MLLSLQQFQGSKISITINDHNHEPLFSVSLSGSLFQVTNLNNHNTDSYDSVDSVIKYIVNDIYAILPNYVCLFFRQNRHKNFYSHLQLNWALVEDENKSCLLSALLLKHPLAIHAAPQRMKIVSGVKTNSPPKTIDLLNIRSPLFFND